MRRRKNKDFNSKQVRDNFVITDTPTETSYVPLIVSFMFGMVIVWLGQTFMKDKINVALSRMKMDKNTVLEYQKQCDIFSQEKQHFLNSELAMYQPETIDDHPFLNHYQNHEHPHKITVTSVFTPEECKKIIKRHQKGLMQANIGSGTHDKARRDGGTRRTKVKGITGRSRNSPDYWIWHRIYSIVKSRNLKYWNYALGANMDSILLENLQFAKYGADELGHYTWHVDVGHKKATAKRRISMTIQLSDPNDYEGGFLELYMGEEIHKASKLQGSATIFCSFVEHRVSPVTKGVRYSLVQWFQVP